MPRKKLPPTIVCGSHVKDTATVSTRLVGKDELIMVECGSCKCTHYYLAQPIPGMKRFRIFELLQGETIARVRAVPSGDIDAEHAFARVEEDADAHPVKRVARKKSER